MEGTFDSIFRGIYYQQTAARYVAIIAHITLTVLNLLRFVRLDNVLHGPHELQNFLGCVIFCHPLIVFAEY